MDFVELVCDHLDVLVCLIEERVEELHLAIHCVVGLLLQYVSLHRLAVAHCLRLLLLAGDQDLLESLISSLVQCGGAVWRQLTLQP